MRFGLVHRVMTDALAALGVLALVASGQFSRPVNVAITLFLAIAIAMKESWRHEAANRHVDTVAVFALVAAQLGRAFFTNSSVLDLLIEFAVGLQIIRVGTRKGAAHDQQVIVLALLHLIAGTVVGGGLGYGLCFFGLLVVTPGALVLSHLRREVEGNYRQGARDRTGLPVDVPRILRSKRVVGRQFIAVTCLLSVPILLFTVALTPSATTLVDVADSPHTFSEGSVVQTLSHVALAGDHEVIGGYHGPDAMPVDGSPAITSGFAGFVIQRETGAGGR